MKGLSFSSLTLLIPDKDDVERDAVAGVWQGHGGEVVRVGRFWEPPDVEPSRVRVYGNNIFCLVLAEKLGLKLISPADDFLATISGSWLKRTVQIRTLAEVESFSFPCFIKPLVPKTFAARVYQSKDELLIECRQLDETTKVILSEVVDIVAEVRSFILDGQIMTAALYEGEADLNGCQEWLDSFLHEYRDSLVKTLVVDAGFIRGEGWAVLEANASWGAGLNGCNPEGAAVCIAEATAFPPSLVKPKEP